MAWSERQLAMLRAMGVQLFAPPAAPAAVRESPAAPAREPAAAAASAADAALAAPGRMAARASAAKRAQPAPPLRADAVGEAGAAPLAPDAVAALDWPALRAAVAACRACRLCETRTQTVFGVGHEHAQWMVVGEAPGAQEDEQGEPFVGAAGQLLDNMLRALELTRAAEGDPARRVYIANTLKCRPPGNRNPQPDELAQCEPFLRRQIALVRPRVILAMGRFAVQSLLRTSEAVGRLRGRVHRYQGVPLIVTYHPAYLLRNLTDKARAWEDLCLAAQVVEQAGD